MGTSRIARFVRHWIRNREQALALPLAVFGGFFGAVVGGTIGAAVGAGIGALSNAVLSYWCAQRIVTHATDGFDPWARKLDELTKPNDFVLHSTPWGLALGHRLTPEASLRFIQSMVADCHLSSDVPEHVRLHFDVCRQLHVYGYFAWDLFTVAAERVYMTLESALGAKFLEGFPHGVPLVKRGTEEKCALQSRNFWEFYDEFRKRRWEGWRVEGYPRFDGGLRSLMGWARASGLLHGQTNLVVEGAMLKLRHLGAHPHAKSRLGPEDSARTIRDVAEIINHLWGQDTPNGRLYPTPPARDVFAVQWESNGGRRVTTKERLGLVPSEERNGQWFLVEAAVCDYDSMALLSWNPDLEMTPHPAVTLWGPGTWEDAVRALAEYRDSGSAPSNLSHWNRIFLVRAHEGGFEAFRSIEQFLRLAEGDRDRPNRRWWIIRADHPRDVYWYMQAQVTASSNPEDANRRFAVEKIGVYPTWQETRQALDTLESEEASQTPNGDNAG